MLLLRTLTADELQLGTEAAVKDVAAMARLLLDRSSRIGEQWSAALVLSAMLPPSLAIQLSR